MATNYLEYRLKGGYVHHWLVAGPHIVPVSNLEQYQRKDLRREVVERHFRREPGIKPRGRPPEERGSFTIRGETVTWRYATCLEDHFLDLAIRLSTCNYLCSWAYAEVVSPSEQEAALTLTAFGPADVWLNGRHVQRRDHFAEREPDGISFPCALQEGANQVLVRLEQVALGACPYAFALQVNGRETEALRVRVPCYNERTDRRQRIERLVEAAFIERDMYAGEDELIVRWPDDLDDKCKLAVRVQKPNGRIYAEARPDAEASASHTMLRAYELEAGSYYVRVMADVLEYHMGDMRVARDLGIYVSRNTHMESTDSTLGERAKQMLEYAVGRADDLYAEIAKMELNQWARVEDSVLRSAVERVNGCQDGSVVDVAGILFILYRYAGHFLFPQQWIEPLEECVLGYRYWDDEPGCDLVEYRKSSAAILYHACQVLAGQRYEDRVFANSGQTGAWHRKAGEQKAHSWLARRAQAGFPEWDSSRSFERSLLALVHLVDLAQDTQLREMAALIVDKILFTMAVNSFKGVLGSARASAHAPIVTDGRLEPTSGLAWMLWGVGCPNPAIAAAVSLACSQEYEMPTLFRSIATDLPEQLLARERHVWEEEAPGRASGTREVNKVTFKTPDYMLCSAQDYRPGEMGCQEHIWQATLAPDAVLFVTHPPHASRSDVYSPNFWVGNRVLPRVAQWRDVLVALHRLPQDDWMGFTHAYFPAAVFDEHVLQEGWAFARKGEGYLALSASQGLELVTRGPYAYRELRSYGQHNVWLCQMGRAELDGDWAAFQDKVLALDVAVDGLSVHCETLRGERVSFDWQGALLVDGQEQSTSGFKHYENPYCVTDLGADQMNIQFGDWILQLDFA